MEAYVVQVHEIYIENETPDLNAVINEFGSGITKYCYNLLWDYHDAQDAAQNVFLVAIEKIDTIRDMQSIRTWLYRVAHNTCMDMLRRKSRDKHLSEREANGVELHIDSYNFGISEELQAALSTLSAKDRALVYNRAVDEMEYDELKEIYGAKPATLRKRYERARKKLEQELRKGVD
jgi:RNA polymerase sigma-70 factor (ECF subfamily)